MNRLAYILKAKTQYNLHSPFVFDLYNEALLPRVDSKKLKINTLSGQERRNAALIYKLADHYAVKHIVLCGFQKGIPFSEWVEIELSGLVGASNIDVRMLGGKKKSNLLIVCPIGCYAMLKEENEGFMSSDTIVVTTNIHDGRLAERQWDNLCFDSFNRLAVDLYSMGVVFYRKELSEERYTLLV